jgi:glycoprotein endo-alpha-1,2-mannosidase
MIGSTIRSKMARLTDFRRATFSAMALGLAVGAGLSTPATGGSQRDTARSPRVMALYYGWYGTPQISGKWQHYEKVEVAAKKISGHVHYPSSGPYDSVDPDVLKRHCKEAREAGVDVLVCSWWGRGDQTDLSFRVLLPIAASNGLKVCALYEGSTQPGLPAVKQDWRYLARDCARLPGYLRVNGKPVVFVYEHALRQLEHEQWQDIIDGVNKEAPPGVMTVADGFGYADALVFDGLCRTSIGVTYQNRPPPATALTFNEGHQWLLSRCGRFSKQAVLTVTPGHDDRRGNAFGLFLERRNGDFYRAQWQEALKQPSAWILINSFNQWHAGNEIEPSTELGGTYLQITKEMAALAHGQPAAQN